MRKLLIIGLLVSGAVLFSQPLRSDEDAPTSDEKKNADQRVVDVWMKAKLNLSQKVFDGLVHGDLDAVAKNATQMRNVGYLEYWLRMGTETARSNYQAQLNRFDFANRELIRLARDKNSKGAAEAYMDMTRSCVRCHQLIRDADTGKR